MSGRYSHGNFCDFAASDFDLNSKIVPFSSQFFNAIPPQFILKKSCLDQANCCKYDKVTVSSLFDKDRHLRAAERSSAIFIFLNILI